MELSAATDGRATPTDAQWDKPSDGLRRMAGAPMMAGMRECELCHHRHPRSEVCAYPTDGKRVCRCES